MLDSNADSPKSTLETLEERLRRGVSQSRLTGGVRTLARFVRHSRLYRWFTTEPEPDVIVIDLRETYTVGPFIRLLDRCLEGVSDAAESSKTAAVAARVDAAFRVRPLRVVGLAMTAAVLGSLVVSLALGRPGTVSIVAHAVLVLISISGLRSERTLEEITETRGWTVLAAAFEPPEPPEKR
ncbi:hypothetical protein [Natronorubrum tibetense]|uniref:Uncharacterized protein n=1 Tax=Natronorubrum tibetense GA33 TaxID=1114856 RepID=L9VTX5_9EURY|nr:hypothetical protein [Natronorubrum tibetense]ELY39718.1 hypothetical protein C496_13611 [Natronorubrum tibetense GA33]